MIPFLQKLKLFIEKTLKKQHKEEVPQKASYRPATILVHGGQKPDPQTGACAVPIYQTSSYVFKNTAHAADLFALKEEGNIYTRLMNPTTDVLEKRIAELDGGAGSLAVASGMSAISLALLNIAQAGDEIVSASTLYGGTRTLFQYTLKRFGITVKFVDPSDPKNFSQAITDKTKALYGETIGNPKLNVLDIEAVADAAHQRGLPLIIDNTATAYLCRPIDYGADIVVYSATKFIGGHGTSLGGLIVDAGKFVWDEQKFPSISQADPSYHGLNFVEQFGPAAYIMKARTGLLRDMGPAMSPFNAFLFLQGMETLHLRMSRHCDNALAVARFLHDHPKVSWVVYPGLDASPEKVKADKYLPFGAGALVGFGIKGGLEGGKTFVNRLKLISHLANIGDAKTLAIHPASTTHQQLSPEEREAAGVSEDFIRLSIGIEDIQDILDDIEQALARV